MVLVKINKNYSKILSGNPKVTMACGTDHCGKVFVKKMQPFNISLTIRNILRKLRLIKM